MSSLDLTIKNLILTEEELTNQMTDNSMDLRLTQKYSSNDIETIRTKYAPEKERINNEIEALDKIEERDEYQDLLTEMKELKEQEEAEITRAEEELSDDETMIQLENETLEVQLEDVKAQKESFQEMRKQNNERIHGYFQ